MNKPHLDALKFSYDRKEEYVIGDFKALDERMFSDINVTVEDVGIGAYEFWGFHGSDHHYQAELEHPGCELIISNVPVAAKYDDIIESLLEGMERTTYNFSSEGRRRGSSVDQDFEIKVILERGKKSFWERLTRKTHLNCFLTWEDA